MTKWYKRRKGRWTVDEYRPYRRRLFMERYTAGDRFRFEAEGEKQYNVLSGY